MFLEVAAQNTAARALYAALGFTETGRRPAYYEDGGDALILALAL
jgi:ribosomal-protein-alanine N-acetyltransferase